MALLLPVVLLGLFYVFLILPKQRELKRHNALVATLDVGDEVMTGSGFYGTLTEVTDDTVLIELAPGIEVKLARKAVAAKIVARPDEIDATDESIVIDALDPAMPDQAMPYQETPQQEAPEQEALPDDEADQ
jgi:preprotein translocase subunit YajC